MNPFLVSAHVSVAHHQVSVINHPLNGTTISSQKRRKKEEETEREWTPLERNEQRESLSPAVEGVKPRQ